jgi:hypothetical protein
MQVLFKIMFATVPGGIMLGAVILMTLYMIWKNLKGFNPIYADAMTDAGIAAFSSVADNLRNQKKDKK